MDSLSPSQRRKVFPAARDALLTHYEAAANVPSWSDIGTVIQAKLRKDVTERLRNTQNDDVADYLDQHVEEANKFLHQRVKSLREKRNQGTPFSCCTTFLPQT